jgi:hypothetical protein
MSTSHTLPPLPELDAIASTVMRIVGLQKDTARHVAEITLEYMAQDRAALSAPAQPASGEAVAYRETITGRLCEPDDEHRRKFPMCYRPLSYADTTPPASQEQADPWKTEAMGKMSRIEESMTLLADKLEQASQEQAQPSGEVHVGESQFEGWYEQHPKVIGGGKQLARDAYAAGMKDKTRTNQGNGKVFLVATGDVYDGEETYTRHAGGPPPLCDFELLYTAPQPVPIRTSIAAIHQRLKFPHRPIDAHAISVVIAECETACPELCGITSNGATDESN